MCALRMKRAYIPAPTNLWSSARLAAFLFCFGSKDWATTVPPGVVIVCTGAGITGCCAFIGPTDTAITLRACPRFT